ncbi:hypothetical protein ACFLWH_00180, partial [Chloroflexota bacterium]
MARVQWEMEGKSKEPDAKINPEKLSVFFYKSRFIYLGAYTLSSCTKNTYIWYNPLKRFLREIIYERFATWNIIR